MRPLAVAPLAVLALLSAPALAQTKQACVGAYTTGQVARTQQSWKAAREQFEICARPACPKTLRNDCGPWLAELVRTQPALLVQVRVPGGAPAGDATVTLDGEVVAADQRVEVDPGKHSVKVERPGAVTDSREVSVEPGEVRTITVALVDATPAPPAPAPPPAAPSRALPIALGSVGVAGLGAFLGFGVAGNSARSSLDAEGCKPNCSTSSVSSIKTDYVVADVALGVGVVSAVAATILYFALPARSAAPVSVGASSLVVRF